jgi:hypothetical protein
MAGAAATQSLAVQRRREARREEWTEQTRLAARLPRYLLDGVFWSGLENVPRSAVSGLMQKRRGARSGLRDPVVLLHAGRAALVELRLSQIPFRHRWRPPRLEPWEGPTENPRERLPQHLQVAAERREATARWRARQRARGDRSVAKAIPPAALNSHTCTGEGPLPEPREAGAQQRQQGLLLMPP